MSELDLLLAVVGVAVTVLVVVGMFLITPLGTVDAGTKPDDSPPDDRARRQRADAAPGGRASGRPAARE
jgi:hypothetical protein